jgi:hypothetical protein
VGVHTSEISLDKTLSNDDRIVLRNTVSDEYFLNETPRLGSADTMHPLLFGRHASGGGVGLEFDLNFSIVQLEDEAQKIKQRRKKKRDCTQQ